MDTSLRLPPVGAEALQTARNTALQAPPPSEEARRTSPATQPRIAEPSTRVDISQAARSAVGPEAPAATRPTEVGPATPTRPEASQANPNAPDDGTRAAHQGLSHAAQDAVQRYSDVAKALPVGQAQPSSVRVSA